MLSLNPKPRTVALSVKVIAGMPPRFLDAKLASKKGRETCLGVLVFRVYGLGV